MIGEKGSDSRIKVILEALELPYRIRSNGDYRVKFKLPSGRIQRVFISSKTSRLAELEVRDVYSVGYVEEGEFEKEIANALLVYNCHAKIGAWQIMRQPDGKYFAAFNIKMAANSDAESMNTALLTAASAADDVEMKLSGGDDIF